MSAALSDVILEVYRGAVERAEPERSRFLEERCRGEDGRVRWVVEEMLRRDPTGASVGDEASWRSLVTSAMTAGTRRGESGEGGGAVSEDETGEGVASEGMMIGAYRVTGTLGVGGMGEVYEAWDERLERRVALKSIRHEWVTDERARRRFMREARVLSSLDHPNICRIYDLVEEGGRAYLVLELVRGEPLSRARGRLSGKDRLRVAEQIARVLAAAHASGVVHRDLKPDNVMVTEEGEAKVLDFGIAGRGRGGRSDGGEGEGRDGGTEGRRDRGTEGQGDGGTEARRDGWGEETGVEEFVLTRPGAVMGTLTYMSPEQAAGAVATAASDMYAFGLLLQELMTGERPYEGGRLDLLERVRAGDARPVRGVRRDVARLIRDLRSVKPSERPNAAEAARRLGLIRTKGRRRAVQGAIAAVVLVGIAGGVKYTVDVTRERAAAVAARADAERLTDYMVGALFEEMEKVGRLDAMAGPAERVLEYYEARDVSRLSDEELLRYSGALQRIGDVQMRRGDLEGAERVFEEQLRVGEALVEKAPSDGARLKALGATRFYLGSVAYRRMDLGRAREEFEAYLEIARRLVELDAENPEWRLELAYAQTNMVQIFQDLGRRGRAMEMLEASLGTKRRLVGMEPSNRAFVMSLANGLTYARELRAAGGDLEGARAAAEEALELLEGYVEREGRDADGRYRLAVGHVHLGELLEEMEEPEEALGEYRAAREALDRLIALEPSNTAWLRERGMVHRRAGRVAMELGRHEEARREIGASRREFEALIEQDPTNGRWVVDLVSAEREAGRLFEREDRAREALEVVERIVDLLTGLLGSASNDAAREEVLWRLGRYERWEGDLRLELGDEGGARGAWRRVVERMGSVWSRHPESAADYAYALLRLGRVEEAREPLARAREGDAAGEALEALAGERGL